ncbi:MAG: CHAT domain-containing protein [bacterium]
MRINLSRQINPSAICACLVIAGCQSSSEQLTIEEAKQIAGQADFQLDFKPPRNLNDIRALFGEVLTIPENCEDQRRDHREYLDLLIDDLPNLPFQEAGFIMADANTELARGSFKRALTLQRWSESQYSLRGWGRQKALAQAGLALIYAVVGDERRAAQYDGLTRASISRIRNPNIRLGPLSRALKAIGLASSAIARGDVNSAEPELRKALRYGVAFKYGLTSINRPWLHAQLVSILLQSGKLLEAEVAAREALREQLAYGAHNADAAMGAAMLASVMVEKERLDDAKFVAYRSINLFESECAFPESIPYVQARRILIEVLSARSEWSQAYQEVVKAKNDLALFPDAFERLFNNSPEIGLAMIHGGEVEAGLKLLRESALQSADEFGDNSLEHYEALGMVATGLSLVNRDMEAAQIYLQILPGVLNDSFYEGRSGSTSKGSQRRMMLASALEVISRSGLKGSGGLDTNSVDTMFRISQAISLTRVQRALSASAVRAAARGAELSTLVRNEQDARNWLANTLEKLSLLSMAPTDQVDPSLLNNLRGRANELRLAIMSLTGEIESKFPGYTELIRPSPLSIEVAKSYLALNEALIRIHIDIDYTFVWALTANNEPTFARIAIGQSQLHQLVDRMRNSIDPTEIETLSDIPEFDIDAAHNLYDALMIPVEAGWIDAEKLLIVADSPLDVIPFAMLVREKAPPVLPGSLSIPFAKYKDNKWFSSTHAFSTLPAVSSLRSFELLQNRVPGSRPFVGFGAPEFGEIQSDGSANVSPSKGTPVEIARRAAIKTRKFDLAKLSMLPPLPETEEELREIARALGANDSDVYVGLEANERRVLSMDLSPFRVIAFATHGLVPGDLDGLEQPALALSAPVDAEGSLDGLLTMDEIVGLKLGADWAVLSACNTGAADGRGAEAISGLGRAFIYAGARSLLVSNWPVHSESTKVLMTDLFRRSTQNSRLGRSEALRQSQIKLMNSIYKDSSGHTVFSFAHPIFWAPFTLIGDGG